MQLPVSIPRVARETPGLTRQVQLMKHAAVLDACATAHKLYILDCKAPALHLPCLRAWAYGVYANIHTVSRIIECEHSVQHAV